MVVLSVKRAPTAYFMQFETTRNNVAEKSTYTETMPHIRPQLGRLS